MKKCKICKEHKSKSEFSPKEIRCKTCNVKRGRDYGRTKSGIIATIYRSQKASSKRRNHPFSEYSSSQLKEWAFSKPIFHELFDKWVESGYDKYSKPSFDRLDDYKGYSFDNLRIVTWKENHEKGIKDKISGINNKDNKSIIQMSLNGEFIKEYHSQSQAGRDLGINKVCISNACRGKVKTASGFTWRFKN